MCLQPLTLPTRQKYINASTIGTRLLNTFNCGHCAECKTAKHLDYYLRCSAEFNETSRKGGFTYWDCFTYDDANLPVMTPNGLERGVQFLDPDYAVMTFNRLDYTNFFKRLRINMTRDGYDVKGNLKYFFVSEYGEERKRPHYHCVFFVTIPDITPELFFDYLNDAWPHGHLDVYHKDNSYKYPKEKVINSLKACNYVSKYVNKEDSYVEVIKQYALDFELKEEDTRILMPFHRQSHGFGLSLIDRKNPEHRRLAVMHGKCFMVEADGKKTFPIPMYNKRKMFYRLVKYSDGSLHWHLNKAGETYKAEQLHRSVIKQAQRFTDAYSTINALRQAYAQYDYKALISSLMGERTFADLAIYSMFYKGRYCHICKPSLTCVIKHDISRKYTDYSSLFGSLENYVDASLFQNLYQNYDNYISRHVSQINSAYAASHTLKEFIKHHAITQDSFTDFKHFDDVLYIFDLYFASSARGSQKRYDDLRSAEDRLKLITTKFHEK